MNPNRRGGGPANHFDTGHQAGHPQRQGGQHPHGGNRNPRPHGGQPGSGHGGGHGGGPGGHSRRPHQGGGQRDGRGQREPQGALRQGAPAPGVGEVTEGLLEIYPAGHGFLRRKENNYVACVGDVYVPAPVVRNVNVREGTLLRGVVAPARGPQGQVTVQQVEVANGHPEGREFIPFERLTSIAPNRRMRLETTSDELSMRVLDLITPIGFGQRGLIVAPPKTGKTTLLQKLAASISTNHPHAKLIVLLIDERPEEVTDFRRSVKGEVIASSSDEMSRQHVNVAEIVLEHARREVEHGRDIVILLDSLTRLARAYNREQRGSGKILTGGIDSRTMEKPRYFFGSARQAEEGGSLTIIASALVDTGSRMDEVIFQEFKGTGNMELVLDRGLFERRVFPAVDISMSGTRREELLFTPDELVKANLLRRVLSSVKPVEAMQLLLDKMSKHPSNAAFLKSLVPV
jgi:transcription termination factor Rho